MVSFRSLLSGAALVLAGAFVFSAGCSKQGEAMRCEQTNGNDDCDPGLFCLGGYEGISDTICCPSDRTQASTDECRRSRGGTTIDAGTSDTSTDTGAADTGAADTGAADTGAADTGAADTGAADTATSADAADAG